MLISSLPSFSPNWYIGRGSFFPCILNKPCARPAKIPPPASSGLTSVFLPDFRSYADLQKVQATTVEDLEEVGSRIFAFDRGILQDGQEELKQNVSPFCFSTDTAPVGLVRESFKVSTLVSSSSIFPSGSFAKSVLVMLVWIQLLAGMGAADPDPRPLGLFPRAWLMFFLPPGPARFIVIVERWVPSTFMVENAPAVAARDKAQPTMVAEVFMMFLCRWKSFLSNNNEFVCCLLFLLSWKKMKNWLSDAWLLLLE